VLGLSADPNSRRGLRALRTALLANLLLASTVPCYAAGELPTGGQVVAGSGAIAGAGNALTVTQSSSRAIINWQSFSIGNGNSVQINNGSGATLNRVIANSPSTIAGSLISTGSTYLINQNGIVVTPTGKIVTGGSFIGSTRDTSDSSFMQGGAQRFTGASSGNIVNQGKIVSIHGDTVLVGKSVDNSGSVSASKGTAGLIAGDDITLQPSGTGLQIKVAAGSGDATNSGTVDAAQAMLNAAGGNVYALAGNNGGTVRATGTSTINGHVWLTAGGEASVTGTVSAQNADGSGGAIAIASRTIDVSGTLDVSAYSPFGSGGSASVIATDTTQVTGTIKARAGNLGGNGGAIETSGNILRIGGATIDAAAPSGAAGAWLLDPYSLTVGASPSDATQSPTGTWTSNAGGGLVLNTDINNALNAGTSVVLQTSGTLGDGFGNGDITVGAAIQMTGLSNASLTLKAAGSIDILQGISSTGGALAVTLNSNTLGGGGYVNIGAAINTNGGALVMGGGANPLTSAAVGTAAQVVGVLVNGAINTAGGALTINGTGYGGSGNGASNNGVSIAAIINAGGGAISITGTGGNSTGNNNIGINQTAAIITTGAGSITLNGTGAGSSSGESGYQTTANITAGTGNISITGVSSAAATGNSTRGVGLLGGTVSTAGAGTITIAGTVLGSGSGASAMSVNGGVTAVDGLISLTGTDNSNSTGAGNNGVNINTVNAVVRSTGTGGVKIVGQGGGSGVSGGNSGVTLNNGGVIQSTGGGAITITGTGGGNGGSGTSNFGVNVGGAIAGSGGAISITGTGGNSSGLNNYGINHGAFAITNTGTGSITLNGTGGGTGASESGYILSGGIVVAGTGNISITGQGSSTAKDGIGLLANGTAISTAGAGTITLTGTATGILTAAREDAVAIIMPNITAVDGLISITGINNSIGIIDGNSGVHLNSGSQVLSTGLGGVSLNGVGGGSGASFNNYGVQINGGNTIQSTGGGAISITGTGGDAGGSGNTNIGVLISPIAGQTLSGSGGAISITGTGGNSSGGTNQGISLLTAISNTGNGSITLLGTGAGSGSGGSNSGVNVSSGSLSTVNGLIKVTGISNSVGTGINNNGVQLSGANNIRTTGTGGITVIGTGGGSGAGNNDFGVVLSATGAIQAAGGGAINITGTGGDSGGSGGSNNGVAFFASPNPVQASGGGSITIIGTGGGSGGSSGNNTGVYFGNNAGLSGNGGAISITGTGGNSSGGGNYGINQNAAISNSGAGSITLNGTGGGSGSGESGYRSFNAAITAGTGDISITGTASAAASGLNDGIQLNFTSISTAGAGKITLFGTATGNGANNGDAGVNMSADTLSAVDGLISITGVNNSTGTGFFHLGVQMTSVPVNVINSGNGGVAITGFGGGSGPSSGDQGVEIGTVQWGGSGAITITGTGGDIGGFGGSSNGVQFDQAFTGTGGAISVTGTGGGFGGSTGIYFGSGATMSNSGTGGVTLNGTIGLPSIAVGAGTITLNSAGTILNSGALTGANLVLLGANANYTLTNSGNAVTTIAANTGSLNYSQTGDLTVGTVGATVGVTASGTVKLVSNGGNLIIASRAGVTAGGTLNALILEAGASTSRPTVTGGDFINNAGAGALSAPNGFWLVYTGHPVGSGTVDGGLTYIPLYDWDTSTAQLPPSGNFMFFRYNPPPVTVDVTASLTGTVIKTYDGTLLATLGAGNYSLSGVNPVDLGNVILTVNGTAINLPTYGSFSTRNVGSDLQVTVTGLGLNQPVSTSYQLTSTTISANIGFINPAQLTLFAVYDQRPYDGTTASSVTPIVSNLQTGDSVTGLTQAFTSRNAMGTFGSTLVVSNYVLTDGNNGNNYTVQTVSGAGTIDPALLTVTAVSDTKVYDGTTNSSGTPTVDGLVSGDSLTGLTQAFISRNVMGTNGSLLVPDYVVNDGNGGHNYTQTFLLAQGTITPAQLVYTADPVSRGYGKGNGKLTGVLGGLQTGDTQASVASGELKFKTSATNASNVGSYAITGSGLTLHSGNYFDLIGQDAGNATALSVVPAQLTYKADKASRTYGAADPVFTGIVTGFVLGQTQASATTGTMVFTTTAIDASNVGKYPIDGSGLTANFGNYYFVQANGNAKALTIDPATLTYTADPASRTFGTANPLFIGTITGFVLGQDQASATTGTMKFTSEAKKTSPVGNYAIKGSGLKANNGNYIFVQAAGNATALAVLP
jgi:MBG domain (YGX type)/YDG domain